MLDSGLVPWTYFLFLALSNLRVPAVGLVWRGDVVQVGEPKDKQEIRTIYASGIDRKEYEKEEYKKGDIEWR